MECTSDGPDTNVKLEPDIEVEEPWVYIYYIIYYLSYYIT